jgi:ATP-dependent Lon protease
MQIRADLQMKIKAHLDNNQKEFVLREQLRVIREELGEDQTSGRIDEYREKAEKLNAPEEVKEVLYKEIGRLSSIGENNPSEGGVIRGYIDTLLALPWNNASEDNTDISVARQVLKEDHYGLEKIKERILEYLAVRILRQKGDSPILCLVGPPGTGKTSIAKSVARALDKKYVRICLGGVRDEAEIRGHRRTYIGAMPGRIIAGLTQAGVRNPLMLLDEIDKVSSDYKGDTSSALLEVLDPEQNIRFSDHYVEVPVDLSEVLFIATANDASNIPRPLLDRMEVIEVSSYTENEKMHIAKEHLIPKQLDANGLKRAELSISDKALSEIISGYTKEAGVRQLERMIARICRKTALKIKEESLKKVSVTGKNLEDMLGKRLYRVNKANRAPQVGIVRGLAWTSVGGETLEVEVNVMPGKGGVRLTGQLGDVMKESAQAGVSYIRSIAGRFGIDEGYFNDHEIHIHIPEGAVPKDGPSAGITMALATLSAIADIPVRSDVAMTGEITLRGRVLPIGGLKEKMLAAKKAGLRTVLVPEDNKPDVDQMDEEITDGLSIEYINDMSQVIKTAFVR